MSIYLKISKSQEKRWSQERLAREAGISYNSLIKSKGQNEKTSKLETLIKLVKTLKGLY